MDFFRDTAYKQGCLGTWVKTVLETSEIFTKGFQLYYKPHLVREVFRKLLNVDEIE